jgi:hypothetical protein
MSAIISIAVYHINDRALMSKNIDAAIAKGVDPVAVRCSFVEKGPFIDPIFQTISGVKP